MTREKKCSKCNGNVVEKSIKIQGTFVPGFFCVECSDVEIENDLSELLLFNKLKKEKYSSTVGLLGNSLIIRIPKDYSDAYKIGRGQEVSLECTSEKEFVVKVEKKGGRNQ